MANLEQFINNDDLCDWDPLTKMAVIHHQFESIHPFYDGNGRTGRIINILYLVKQGLLSVPVLYLSRYINQHKAEYYHLLNSESEMLGMNGCCISLTAWQNISSDNSSHPGNQGFDAASPTSCATNCPKFTVS